MSLQRLARMLAVLLMSASAVGCSIAPKSFRKMNDPAPIVRARAVGLAEGLPAEEAVPSLIEHLRDPDPVVRMAASEELRKKTGQSLGFLPWGNEEEREAAVNRWRDWWARRGGQVPSAPTSNRRAR